MPLSTYWKERLIRLTRVVALVTLVDICLSNDSFESMKTPKSFSSIELLSILSSIEYSALKSGLFPILMETHLSGRNFNSLAPGRFQCNFRYVIFKLTLVNGGWVISYEIALRWMPLDFTDDKSTLVQVMAWCRQATSHYLSQCWPRSLSPYGVTRPQWVNKDSLVQLNKRLKSCWRSSISCWQWISLKIFVSSA